MAIKIIKSGTLVYIGFCSRCGCEFSYDLGDLKLSTGNRISCPTCGEYFFHPVQTRTLNSFGFDNQATNNPCADCAWPQLVAQNGSYTGDSPCNWCPKIQNTGIQLAYQKKSILADSTFCGSEATCLCKGDIWVQKGDCVECDSCTNSVDAEVRSLTACESCQV
jgi:DNA-directed RNA polymerase subunit RPC12/RpoP